MFVSGMNFVCFLVVWVLCLFRFLYVLCIILWRVRWCGLVGCLRIFGMLKLVFGGGFYEEFIGLGMLKLGGGFGGKGCDWGGMLNGCGF